MTLTKKRSFGSTLLALLALVTQLALATADPIADAHEPNFVGAHFDGPQQHHAAHNPETCALCLATHSFSVPVAEPFVRLFSSLTRIEQVAEASELVSEQAPTLHSARAPPAHA